MGDIQVLQIGMDLIENASFSVKHFTVKPSFMAALLKWPDFLAH